jgi:hypothetical protein
MIIDGRECPYAEGGSCEEQGPELVYLILQNDSGLTPTAARPT